MEKKHFDFKKYKHNQIGGIYTRLNTFFSNVQTSLNEANLPVYETQYKAIWDDAIKIMDKEHYTKDYATNTKRWERIKKQFLPTISPIQPQPTKEISSEKSAVNEPKMCLEDKDKEIERLKQIIENKDIIIQSLMKITNLQMNYRL